MLIFWDFSKFLKILKSVIQYLCRDISNVKIGLYLRSSHKKDWKTHFGPYSLKKSKNWKKKTVAPPHFSVSFRQKKNFENRTTVAMRLDPPPSPRHNKSSTPVCMFKVYAQEAFFYREICKNAPIPISDARFSEKKKVHPAYFIKFQPAYTCWRSQHDRWRGQRGGVLGGEAPPIKGGPGALAPRKYFGFEAGWGVSNRLKNAFICHIFDWNCK